MKNTTQSVAGQPAQPTASQHTPTPWFVEHLMHGGGRIVHGQKDPVTGFMDDVPLREYSGIAEANAAFIVRAVNSHDALVEALALMASYHNQSPYGNQARAALAAAKGGAS